MGRLVFGFLVLCSLVLASPAQQPGGSWKFFAGQGAFAQSSAPESETNGQEAPEDTAPSEEPEPNIADTFHDAIAGGVTGTGEWLDSFFGTEHHEAETNKTRVRVRVGGFVEEHSDPGLRFRVKARLVLPGTGKRLGLFFSGDGDDDSDLENTNSDEAAEEFSSTDEENAAVGLQYFIAQTKKSSLAAIAGLRFRKISPVGVFGARYRHTLDLDPWSVRFTQRAVWLTDNGFGLPTRLDFDRRVTETVLSRTTLKGAWYESEDGYFYDANQTLIQFLDEKSAVFYSWNNQFQTEPSNRLEETNVRIQYRRAIWRDWLFFDIAPQLTFPKDRDYSPTPGIYGGIEVRFGG